MNEQIHGQGELFRATENVPAVETTKPEPQREMPSRPAEVTEKSLILKLKTEISDTEKELDIMEKQADDGMLPSGAFFRLESLRAKHAGLINSLTEIDKPTSIFEVLPDEFIDRFEYYKKSLEIPESDEASRFVGLVRLIRKNPGVHHKALNNPKYTEYIENLDI